MPPWDWLDIQRAQFWEVCANIVGIVGGLCAAFRWLHELRESRLQRAQELAWNQAKALRELVESIYDDPRSRDALLMLDYTERRYEIGPGHTKVITRRDVERGLRIKNLSFPPREAYARDCFDALFRRLEDVDRALQIGLVRCDHVIQTFEYYFSLLARHRDVVQQFLTFYQLDRVLHLLRESPEWQTTSENKPPSVGPAKAI